MYLNVDAQNFNQSLFIRESRECTQGQLWYVCSANDFHGCCSVDACAVSECPDSNTAAVGASSTSTTSTPSKSTSSTFSTSSTSSASSSTTASTTSSQTTESSQSILQTTPQSAPQTLSPSTVLLTTTDNHPVSAPTQTLSSSPTTVAQTTPPTSSSNSTSIIAGAVVGGVALICFAMAAFCCFRFRQKKKQDRERMFAEPESSDLETIQFYSTTGKTLQTPSSKSTRSPGLSGLGLGDVFAPFGGRTRTSSNSAPPKSPPGGPAMSESQVSAPSHSIPTVHPSLIPKPQEDDEHDRPLSHDPEKSSLAPPPESSHPAFHPLPGMPSPRPAHRSGMGITMSELDGREIGRRSVSVGGSERMSGSGSEGAVSAMSTPSHSVILGASTNLAQGQAQGYWYPNAPPNLPLSLSGRPIQSHSRGNSSNLSNSCSINPDPNMNKAPASQYAQNQYSRQQAQHQYTQQLASARHMKGMNASTNEHQNPYQMYRDSREHQQNMGYQHALVRAQEERARAFSEMQQGYGQTLGQRNVQKGKGRESMNSTSQEVHTEENDDKELRRESSTHSIPIGLGLDARPTPREPERDTNPQNEDAQMQVHASLYGKQEEFPQSLSHQGSQPTQSNAAKQTYQTHRANTDSVSSMGSPSSTSANVGAWNPEPVYTHPGFDFECKVVAPTPPPQMMEISEGVEKKRNHVLSWSEYDAGGELSISPVLDGKGKGEEIVE
ncbi:uncharacterized protein EAE97_008393 [Botrytis byssoidea]|uniref:Uncharacterized protein n=1 Tax=Botrytis byssoidea TaxID=139641 RepID=A0A9P5IH06_9HELO|nr:uncharacterized protein EAE97_008393 [Botrytis byssoidea]KAF7934033.1 hypothetical protein EAE97_008393 [Botrytis byssoidea]